MSVEPDNAFLSLIIYTVGVIIVIGAMLGLSFILGQRHQERATNEPYESGILITGNARTRFPAKFYLIAVFFVLFDLEAIYLFAWATAVPELGWSGFIKVLVFIGILLAAFIYLWRTGGLSFGHTYRKVSNDDSTTK